MPPPVRQALPIRFRFAALISGLLLVTIGLFGGAAHWEIRRAALRSATERIQAVSRETAQLLETSTAAIRSQLIAAANRPLVREALRAPNGDSARVFTRSTGAGSATVLGTQLFDASGVLVLTTSPRAPALTPEEMAALITLTRDSAPAATGALRLVGDSVAYPTIARVQDGTRTLGFLVYWRRIAGSEEGRRQLGGLIGSGARLSVGNARGDLWTNLITRIDPPPRQISWDVATIHDQPRREGVHLASAVPLTGSPWVLLIEFPHSAILSNLPLTLARLGGVAVLLLAIGAAGAWRMSKSFTRPIAELAAATTALRSGDFSRRVAVGRRDELGDLASLFNEMAGAISGGKEQIEQQLGRLKALRTIDLAILGTTDLQLLLRSVLSETVAQLHADAAVIFLFNPHTLTVDTSASVGYRTHAAEREKIRLGDGVAGKAARERRTIAVPDLSQVEMSDALRKVASEEGVQAVYAIPLISKGQVIGVLDVLFRRPFAASSDWLEFCEALAGQAAMAIESCKTFDDLQRSNLELSLAYDTTIEGWSRALDLRDKETEGHSQRVTDMTLRLARLSGMSSADMVHVRRGALLHDIGKMGIPDTILLKPGKLDDREWEIMRMHPTYAYELLLPIAHLRPALDIPYCHHEKWDGSGYPNGHKGKRIPIAARLFAVVDVWDALRSDRPYRPGWEESRVLEHIRTQAGMHFDPEAVSLFSRAMREAPAGAHPSDLGVVGAL